jgi:hypothetical protein
MRRGMGGVLGWLAGAAEVCCRRWLDCAAGPYAKKPEKAQCCLMIFMFPDVPYDPEKWPSAPYRGARGRDPDQKLSRYVNGLRKTAAAGVPVVSLRWFGSGKVKCVIDCAIGLCRHHQIVYFRRIALAPGDAATRCGTGQIGSCALPLAMDQSNGPVGAVGGAVGVDSKLQHRA